MRDYRGGLGDWIESGLPVETVAGGSTPAPGVDPLGPKLVVSPNGFDGSGPARITIRGRRSDSASELVLQLSTTQLFLIWFGKVVLCGVGYWLLALLGEHGLVEAGLPVKVDQKGLLSYLYFSFVTATSLGYGDVVPVGIARIVAVAESVTVLLVFGAVVAKFVAHRQDELVPEIHRITFDERLDRVQSDLHLIISELLSLNSLCEARTTPLQRESP